PRVTIPLFSREQQYARWLRARRVPATGRSPSSCRRAVPANGRGGIRGCVRARVPRTQAIDRERCGRYASRPQSRSLRRPPDARRSCACRNATICDHGSGVRPVAWVCPTSHPIRSEEHTSELQSRENLVCRLLLEKQKEQTQGPALQNRYGTHL